MSSAQHFPSLDELEQQRGRLVRLCATLTGDADAADDLAQETLIEAWRHLQALRSPEAFNSWLGGIARNVSLRWLRKRARRVTELDLARYSVTHAEPAADIDPEHDLERDELTELLDRALALLPAASREVLVRRYVDESPLAEIAGRLGLSQGAVAMRLQRGRLALQQLLRTELREAAAAFDLVQPDAADEWRTTRIWCFYCGQHRLIGRFQRHAGGVLFQLRCPQPCGGVQTYVSYSDGPLFVPLLSGISSFKPVLARVMGWADEFYRLGDGLRQHVPCIGCGRPATVVLELPAAVPRRFEERGLHQHCEHCSGEFPPPHESLTGLVLCLPEGRSFWRAHQRIRVLPQRELEAEGRPALAIAFEQIGGSAALGVVLDRESYRVLRVHTNA